MKISIFQQQKIRFDEKDRWSNKVSLRDKSIPIFPTSTAYMCVTKDALIWEQL